MIKRLLLLAFIAAASQAAAEDVQCVAERAAMVETIRAYGRSYADVLGPQGISPSVLEAVGRTPRHRFIPGSSCATAYQDAPLPIGQGQTISQPYMVARLCELARLEGHERVLDVGAGSGYQTAVLAELAGQVFAVELRPELGEQARKRIASMGYRNV